MASGSLACPSEESTDAPEVVASLSALAGAQLGWIRDGGQAPQCNLGDRNWFHQCGQIAREMAQGQRYRRHTASAAVRYRPSGSRGASDTVALANSGATWFINARWFGGNACERGPTAAKAFFENHGRDAGVEGFVILTPPTRPVRVAYRCRPWFVDDAQSEGTIPSLAREISVQPDVLIVFSA